VTNATTVLIVGMLFSIEIIVVVNVMTTKTVDAIISLPIGFTLLEA
jgi:hypothetical protein